MREAPWSRLPITIILTCLMKVTEIQAQCVRPYFGGNRVMIDLSQESYPNGSVVKFQCSTGYRPVDSTASRTVTCVGTEWTNLALNCTKKSCGALSDLPNGRYDYPDGVLFGAIAVAQCDKGYIIHGANTRNCRDGGWDGRDPVCEAVKCARPPDIQNGTFEPVDEVYDYSQAVVYSCKKDYTLIGESTLFCYENATFYPPPPQCLLVTCETPNIENAERVEGKRPPYGYKNFVRYQCVAGYTMKGSDLIVCLPNGWNPPPPTCTTIQNPAPPTTSPPQTTSPPPMTSPPPHKQSCRPLPGLLHGNYAYPDGVLVGATAVAQCNKGYILVGEKTRNCRDDGWDGEDPVCEAIQNPAPLTTSPPSHSACVKPSLMMISAVWMLLSF